MPSAMIPIVEPECLQNEAVSTGRCNTGLEFTSWSFNVQSLARSLIEAQGYFVEVDLRVAGQVGFPGEVLSQQAVGIFVGAALPRTFFNKFLGLQSQRAIYRALSATEGVRSH